MGSYGATIGGQCIWASQYCIGLPSFDITHDETVVNDMENYWKKIKSNDLRHYTIMAGSKGQGERHSDTGIVQGHAYSVIGAYEAEVEGDIHKVLKLRNPWGKTEWKGLWSDDSEIWTPELRR